MLQNYAGSIEWDQDYNVKLADKELTLLKSLFTLPNILDIYSEYNKDTW